MKILTRCLQKHWKNSGNARLRNLIVRHTELTRDHLTPEISLRLLTKNCNLWWEKDSQKWPFNDPFWSIYWPGGQAITRYILDSPEHFIENKTILDVGSGCGASAIASVLKGAKYCVANDIDEVAACAIGLNAEYNNLRPDKLGIVCDDLISLSTNDERSWDTVIVGDMFYDQTFASKLMEWLNKLRRQGSEIIIGDPGRISFFQDNNGIYLKQLECLVTYELDETAKSENYGLVHSKVWKMK